KKAEELAALRAWQAFFARLDDPTEQNLSAWTKAIDRIGKGTGKYAYRHRRTARQYLMACIPKIPAWIMPLHKLWDTTNAEPGLFDTVIIDEASQAGIESLALLLLAKRIVVVGDDKQNSPEAVGVLENDIVRLARDHLREFRFRDEFRPDTSLFDHAERAFGNLISLREHFRCVPEIIRFSNELCYTDAPLIPLRQAPPNRLQPLLATFVDKGFCEGEGQRIINRAEVERIVKTIQECLDDEAYEGKTMGVIVLQGHAQAELIEKKLAEILEPKTREERKLRCGVPATFQGDQRDVVFLSLVVAPDHRSRALTGLADQRRFNVAMSRARDQIRLFHSVQQHDLSREDFRWRLLNFFYSPGQGALDGLYEELDRLEREAKRSPRRIGEQPDPYDSWFEVDVALELLRRKYKVRAQYDVAGKPIDLVAEGLENRLGVECDGDFWHGPERYEHDMTIQRRLERAGWTIVRIPESEFYADRARAMQQIIEECDRLDIRPVDQLQALASQELAREATAISPGMKIADDDFARQREADAESAAFPESDSTAEFGPFTSYSAACGFPDPRDASPANVRVALRQVIEKDGPLTRDSVYQLYVEGCPALQRVGKAVRQALNRALGAMLRSGEILQEDELGEGSPEGLVVRPAGTPKVLERPAGRRDLLEIPPSELLLLLDRIRASSASAVLDDETLARALLDHYGFTRLTEVRRKHLARILDVHRRQSQESSTRIDAHEGRAV
ncbi:MAG: AAA domain-containing protein, partial [Acidobacteriota bacterium]